MLNKFIQQQLQDLFIQLQTEKQTQAIFLKYLNECFKLLIVLLKTEIFQDFNLVQLYLLLTQIVNEVSKKEESFRDNCFICSMDLDQLKQ